jgi:peptide/nickel transport system ATP-binding protein
MIFQDPLSSLHHYYSVGDQIIEAYRIHNHASKKAREGRGPHLSGRLEAVRRAMQ